MCAFIKDKFPAAGRLNALPPYLFAEIDRVKQDLIRQGKDIIDLGVGDPDLPTPNIVIEELYRAAQDPANHRYASSSGMPELRSEIAKWYKRRFDVDLDPDKEVLPLLGSKEGIGHLPLAMLNPGEAALIPNPAYPVYRSGTVFAGAEPIEMPLTEEHAYLPDLTKIPEAVLGRIKLMFLNYPNNPTAATCDHAFFNFALSFAAQHGIAIAHDFAYSEIAYDGYRPVSFLEVDGAKEMGVEFHSISKTCNMTGWRVGFAVGNKNILSLLARVKSNLDSGIFQAVQRAAIKALQNSEMIVEQNMGVYRKRRALVLETLEAIGLNVAPARAGFFIWAPVPDGMTSAAFTAKLLEEAHIVVTPGDGFGSCGAGYFRIALTVPDGRLEEAMKRLKKLSWS